MRHWRLFTGIITSFAVLFLVACQDQPTAPISTSDRAPAGAPVLSEEGSGWEYTDEHVVLFEDGVPTDFADRIVALGGSVVRVHPEIDVAIVTGLTDDAGTQLAAYADIAAAPRDVSVKAIPDLAEMGGGETQSLPGDAPAPAGHDPTAAFFFAAFQWDMRIIDADDAWNAGYNDATGIDVAILDTGIDPFHVDMLGRVDFARSIAFVPSLAPGPPWGDDNFHGTHVGGTVSSNGFGTSGVAPHATLIAVKVCNVVGSCPFAAIISGLVWSALVGADVANMSLGGFLNIPSPGGGQLNAALNRAVNFANSRGTLVVSAAGNSAVDLDHIERDFGVNAFRATPCENGAGMCVSATGPTDALASYSNFGNSAINVAAPGGDFNVTGSGFGDTVLAPCSTLSLIIPICQLGGFWLFLQGTSMAAPHVSGAAALLDAQSGGGMNAGRLKSALQRTADDLGKKGNDPFYGKGRINVFNLVQ